MANIKYRYAICLVCHTPFLYRATENPQKCEWWNGNRWQKSYLDYLESHWEAITPERAKQCFPRAEIEIEPTKYVHSSNGFIYWIEDDGVMFSSNATESNRSNMPMATFQLHLVLGYLTPISNTNNSNTPNQDTNQKTKYYLNILGHFARVYKTAGGGKRYWSYHLNKWSNVGPANDLNDDCFVQITEKQANLIIEKQKEQRAKDRP